MKKKTQTPKPAAASCSAAVDHQKDCRSLSEVIAELQRIYEHPDWKFEKFEIWGVDPSGGTARLKWDRRDIKHRQQNS